jgi:hypothetical protein
MATRDSNIQGLQTPPTGSTRPAIPFATAPTTAANPTGAAQTPNDAMLIASAAIESATVALVNGENTARDLLSVQDSMAAMKAMLDRQTAELEKQRQALAVSTAVSLLKLLEIYCLC